MRAISTILILQFSKVAERSIVINFIKKPDKEEGFWKNIGYNSSDILLNILTKFGLNAIKIS